MPANTPRLETERLVLRRFTPADVEPLFSLMRDREVNTFLPLRHLPAGERPPHRLPPCGRRGEP